MITFEIFEETGPVVAGRGTVSPITNMNWKRTSDVTQPYYFYPLQRPALAKDQTLSFKKYIFFKASGSYSKIKNIKVTLSLIGGATQASGTQLFYKLSNVYEQPNDLYDGSMMLMNGAELVLHPNTSQTSPILATSRPTSLTNQTFYTGYIVTQLRVPQAAYSDVGNSAGVKINLTVSEYE